MKKYIIILLFSIFKSFSLYSQTIDFSKSEDGSEMALSSDIRISYDTLANKESWHYEPYYKCDMGLSAYKLKDSVYYYITVNFSNNNHHLLKHYDHSIKIKTPSKTINLKYQERFATLHEEKHELVRTGRRTYSGTIKIGTDIERYEVSIKDPSSDEVTSRRIEPYKMTVVYYISENDLKELFKGIKSIKINNAMVKHSMFTNGRSDITYKYDDDKISDFLYRCYTLINERFK